MTALCCQTGRRHVVPLIFFLSLCGGLLSTSNVRAASHYYVPPMPRDFEQVDFSLLTSGVGDQVANRFGHTGIRIRDQLAGTDVVFNWGTFSFDDSFFLWKFFRGQLRYRLGVRSYQDHLMQSDADKRRLWEEPLNLTSLQKRRLLEKIAWNAIPEHRQFSYQYWYKNCATIPRDYLDEVLEGALRAHFYKKLLPVHFRDYVRGNLQNMPFVAPTLDILMNSNIDRPITVWEDMFLPTKLREHLLTMPAIDDGGNPVRGTALLGATKLLLDYPEDYSRPFNDYFGLASFFVAPLVLGCLFCCSLPWRRFGWRCLGLAAMTYGVFAGGFGTLLLLDWLFSGHPDTWHNADLLLFWPVDFLFLAYGLAVLKRGGPVKDRLFFTKSALFLGSAHIGMQILLIVLAATGLVTQDIWRVTLWFGVPGLIIAILTASLFREPEPVGAKSDAESVPKRLKVKNLRSAGQRV